MTGDEYVEAMHVIGLACRLLLNLDDRLDTCLRTVETGETIGPVLDPTAYATGGMTNLREQRSILEPAIALRDAARGIAPERFDITLPAVPPRQHIPAR